jgi:hypothetical protein
MNWSRMLGGLLAIDPAADQPRAVLAQRQLNQLLEGAFVRRPRTLCNPGAAGHCNDIGAEFRRRELPAGDLVGAVVHDHDGKVLLPAPGNRGE